MPNFLIGALDGAATAVTASDWAPVLESITGQISVSTVVGVLASVILGGIGLVFMWWGLRKAVNAIMNAFKKGKLTF